MGMTMRVLIYGGGSVGLGVASCLLNSGVDIDIIAREDSVEQLQNGGLKRTGIFGDYYAPPDAFGCFGSMDEIKAVLYDYVLVCTKSFDSAATAKDLSVHRNCFNDQTIIVLFQNGWGNAEVFLSFFEPSIIYNARVITGFRRPHKNEVIITVHADSIHVGSLFKASSSRVENLCRVIQDGGIPCETTDSIEKDLWAKMLYNCALNPLGAILNVPYGILGKHNFTRIIMDGIVEEVFSVMNAADFKSHWQRPKDFLEVFYNELVPDTAEHRSSTLQDIMANKPTEMDALNGAVIGLAEKFGLGVPINQTVYNMVKFAELRNR